MQTAALICLIAIALVLASIAAILVALLLYVQRLSADMVLLLQHVGVDAGKLGKRRYHVGQGF